MFRGSTSEPCAKAVRHFVPACSARPGCPVSSACAPGGVPPRAVRPPWDAPAERLAFASDTPRRTEIAPHLRDDGGGVRLTPEASEDLDQRGDGAFDCLLADTPRAHSAVVARVHLGRHPAQVFVGEPEGDAQVQGRGEPRSRRRRQERRALTQRATQFVRARTAVDSEDERCPRSDVDPMTERAASGARFRHDDAARVALRKRSGRTPEMPLARVAAALRAARAPKFARLAHEPTVGDPRRRFLGARSGVVGRADAPVHRFERGRPSARNRGAATRREIDFLVRAARLERAPISAETRSHTAVRVARLWGDARAEQRARSLDARAATAHARGVARARGGPRSPRGRRGNRARFGAAPARTACDEPREFERGGRRPAWFRPRRAPHRARCYRLGVVFATFVDGSAECEAALARLELRGDADLAKVEPAVREIIDAVRTEGDAGVQAYNERFGRRAPALVLHDYPGAASLDRLPPESRDALELAAARVRAYHQHEVDTGFRYEDAGITLGCRVLPVARAGVYAPGGKARYPSSVIMSAIPAQVAGVKEIVLATPLSGDDSDDGIFAAAHLAGVTMIVNAGGAQAIAALAYGTQTIPRVDKIVGPGNVYVACAKRLVFGAVAIDGIAGPSEIVVVADDEADPRIIAADLLSQAEHDEAAYPLLVCSSELMADAVRRELVRQLETLPRAATARAALSNGAAFVARSRERMAAIADRLAVEHLALHLAEPEALLSQIRRAGAAFLGTSTPEAMGDYLAGPSHVLPTGGAVRFGSPLGVYDFVTRTSIIRYSPHALEQHRRAVCAFARLEGLEAHARAVEARASPGR